MGKGARLRYIQKAVQRCMKLKGDIAEAGVYKGESAEAICKIKGEKTLHLFDTFTGLPEEMFTPIDSIDRVSRKYMQPNMYRASLESVKERLKKYNKIRFYKGLIPDTFKGLKRKKYCFIHIDVDLYKSTLEALKYFLPRRVKGGIIMIHNYNEFIGVRQAISDAGIEEVEEGKYTYCFL